MKKKYLYLLSLLSGLLFALSWPEIGNITFLLFIVFIPLFFIAENLLTKQKKIFPYSFITFFTFNVLTTWWILNASVVGGILAIFLNSLFMSFVFQLFHWIRKTQGNKKGWISFILLWISFEYLHLNWDLSWSWLTLGNGFANTTWMIQWYEYIGHTGGTLWILLINILIFYITKDLINKKIKQSKFYFKLFLFCILFICPIIFSLFLLSNYKEINNPKEILIIQPNIDPYKKFGEISANQQLVNILNLLQNNLSNKTSFIVAPETAIPKTISEQNIEMFSEIKLFKHFLLNFPNTSLIIGASTVYVYGTTKPNSNTVRYSKESNYYYNYYNTALQIQNNHKTQLYHKSKLVPGVEFLPFPQIFLPLQQIIFDLGGTSGSLGFQKQRINFVANDSTKIAPVICYESIFGEYVGEYIKKGAELIFIITNDGWWGDTPGYKQHLAYAKLRAIEHRRSIVRSANTGISCFIDQTGHIYKSSQWWQKTVISGIVNKNSKFTFYTKYGNFISRIFSFLAVFVLLINISINLRNKNKLFKTAAK